MKLYEIHNENESELVTEDVEKLLVFDGPLGDEGALYYTVTISYKEKELSDYIGKYNITIVATHYNIDNVWLEYTIPLSNLCPLGPLELPEIGTKRYQVGEDSIMFSLGTFYAENADGC